jgi:hypothetical protein
MTIKGDLTQNGKIDYEDFRLFGRLILNPDLIVDNDLIVGDINNDGKINGIDQAFVRMHIMGRKMITEVIYND